MDKGFKDLRAKFLYENGYYEREYLAEDEIRRINEMSRKERNAYLEENKINNNEYYGAASERYYRIRVWDVSTDELQFLIQVSNNKGIKNIEKMVGFFYGLAIIGLIIGVIAFLVAVNS